MYSYTCVLILVRRLLCKIFKENRNKNKNIIMTIENIIILKYLFCFFVLSTKLTYSSSKFVLMFTLYVFSYNILQ